MKVEISDELCYILLSAGMVIYLAQVGIILKLITH